jgi:serine/threonine protein kinase
VEERTQLLDLKREAMMLHDLRHENILSFRGVVLAPGTEDVRWIVTELADDTLEGYLEIQRISDAGGVSLSTLLDVLSDCLKAMCYLHRKGIIHRDIKPANILQYFLRGDGVMFKLGDVGLAKHHSATARGVGVPAALSTSTLGTPFIAAPEVLDGTVGFTPKADVFSLGIVACYMVLGFLKGVPSQVEHPMMTYSTDRDRLKHDAVTAARVLSPKIADLLVGMTHTNPLGRFDASLALQTVVLLQRVIKEMPTATAGPARPDVAVSGHEDVERHAQQLEWNWWGIAA